MLVNADFGRRAVVRPGDYEWVASPQHGVERVMLDRIGAEQARATSIVRYAPDSHFPRHAHPGGEEILVLDGVFSDDAADYPAGYYLRNPPGSAHTPSSRGGATIFVKLRQMAAGDTRQVRVDTRAPGAWRRDSDRAVCLLFESACEQVCLLRLDAGAAVFEGPLAGAEILVLAGELLADGECFAAGAWLRLPAGSWPDYRAGAAGARIYLKLGAPINPDGSDR